MKNMVLYHLQHYSCRGSEDFFKCKGCNEVNWNYTVGLRGPCHTCPFVMHPSRMLFRLLLWKLVIVVGDFPIWSSQEREAFQHTVGNMYAQKLEALNFSTIDADWDVYISFPDVSNQLLHIADIEVEVAVLTSCQQALSLS